MIIRVATLCLSLLWVCATSIHAREITEPSVARATSVTPGNPAIVVQPGNLLPLTATRPAVDPQEGVLPTPAMGVGGWHDSITLDVPPAPANSEPRIAILANHLVTDGILGAGYQLQGMSSIVRRGANGGIPGTGGADSFFLDGQRLVRGYSGIAQPNGTPAAVYQPEMFDGSQLEYDAATNTWTMGREGWTFVYGSSAGTSLNATKTLNLARLTKGGDVARTLAPMEDCLVQDALCNTGEWLLSRVEDPNGNVTTYDYKVASLPSDLFMGYGLKSSGEYLLSTIRYNGGDARLQFNYKTRPDVQVSFASGAATFASQRLSEIISYGRDNMEYSRYRVEYKDEKGLDCDGGAVSGMDEVDRPLQTLIRRILRVATAGHADAGKERVLRCLTTHHSQISWEPARDVSRDISQPLGTSVPFNTLLPVPVHLDGDGISDLILLAYKSSGQGEVRHQAFRATPLDAKWFQATGAEVQSWVDLLMEKLPADHFKSRRGFAFIDLNRDDWTDLVYETLPKDDGVGDVYVARWEPTTKRFVHTKLAILGCDLRHGQFADVDGDGFPDLVRLAHAEGTDKCIARGSEWLRNSGLLPWFDRGESNINWTALATPAASIVESATIVAPDLNNAWTAEQYVEAQGRLLDLNGDGLVDLAYALWQKWREVCDPKDTRICWQEPDWTTHYSRIYWGDGRGRFLDSGLSAGGPVLTRRTGVSESADSRILNATLGAVDFMRGGSAQLLTTYNTISNGLIGAKWRGIKWGYGSEAVTSAAAQPAWAVYPTFNFSLPQQPGLGDSCYSNSAWLAYGDFDGDGFTDTLSFNLSATPLSGCTNTYCVKLIANARTVSQGRTTASDGSWGGRTTLQWGSSADAASQNLSADFPGSVEVLKEVNGAQGRVRMHYAHPTQSQGRFQGFGVVERKGARGGLDRFAFGVSPAMAGKLLYGARYRTDDTLERATIFAYQGKADANCFPVGGCVQAPGYGKASSYTLDLKPPFANLAIRQCDYEVERANLALGGGADIPGLIDHCYRWKGRTAPSQPQLLAAAGLYRYPGLGWPAYALTRSLWQDEARTATAIAQAIALSDANEPDGDHAQSWGFSDLSAWNASGTATTARWVGSQPLPPVPDPEKLILVHEKARGNGFSAYVVDRTYEDTSYALIDEYNHRDVRTPDDDLHRVNTWEAAPRPSWAHGALPSKRMKRSTMSEAKGRLLWQRTWSDFDAGGFNLPKIVTICGARGQACRVHRYTYFANGEVASHTRPDTAVESFTQEPFCGTETFRDVAGHQDVKTYDQRCRLFSRTYLGVQYAWTYDGQNRITRTSQRPNADGAVTTTAFTQTDKFTHVQDRLYQEPRLRELREHDGRLQLTYLDDFGRITKRVACEVAKSAAGLVCQAGSEQVKEWNLWGTDGLVYASARPHLATGSNAETPAFTVTRRDGAGRPILHQTPAHVNLATQAAAWLDERTWYAPGRVVIRDALNRVSVTATDTLHRSLDISDQRVAQATLDAEGRPASVVGPEGVEITYTWTPHGLIATESRAAKAQSLVGAQWLLTGWQRQREYDVLDRLIRVTQADGTVQEISRDVLGRPLTVSHRPAKGRGASTLRTLTYTTTNDGIDVITDIDESGWKVVKRLDGLGRIMEEDDGLGTVTSWQYGVGGAATSQRVTGGGLQLVTSYGYDVAGHMISRTEPDGTATRYLYNGAGDLLQVTDPHGARRTYSYLFSGRPFEARLQGTSGSWLLSRRHYDAGGRLARRDEGAVSTAYESDDLDRRIREVVGSAQISVETRTTYEGASPRPLTRERVASGLATAAVTERAYDPWGRMRTLTNPDGNSTQWRYDIMDNLRAEIDAEGYQRETRYDDRGRTIYQALAGRNYQTIAYSTGAALALQDGTQMQNLQRVTTADAAGNSTERWYAGDGRLIAQSRADGTRLERRYAGTRLTDEFAIASGKAATQRRTSYLASGIIDAQHGPADPSVFTAFDPDKYAGPWVRYGIGAGNRLNWIDAGGERTTFDYSLEGLLQAEHFRGLTRTLLRSFDAASASNDARIAEETLQRDIGGTVRRTQFEFDAVGRLVKRKVEDDKTQQLAFWEHFDQDNRPWKDRNLIDGKRQVLHQWEYSPAGLPKSRQTTVSGNPPQLTTWQWRKNGALERVTGPNGDGFVYDYGATFDGEIDLVKRVSGALLAEVLTRDARGLPTTLRPADGGEITLSYDAQARVVNHRRTAPDGSLALEAQTRYDDLGRIAREAYSDKDASWANDYLYDAAGRLTSEKRQRGAVSETLSYTVNAAGYRTATSGTLDGIDQTLKIGYDPAFPVERAITITPSSGSSTIVYDPWDNVLTDQHANSFTYSPAGDLISARAGNVTRRYWRDAAGVPWGEDDGRGTRLTIWDLDPARRPLHVKDPVAGAFGYAHLDGMLLGRIDYGAGKLQSEMANLTGTLVADGGARRNMGSAFGVGLNASTVPGERMIYAGMESLPNSQDVHLARRRAYDSRTGRFLSLDPIGLRGGLHRSLYASADPVNRSDPLGLRDCGSSAPPDISHDAIHLQPPAYIQGPEGGPASPFGPGVAVSYVNQGAGDKTFQDTMNKWYSDYLTAMSAGIFSGDNASDDTDASPGSNSGQELGARPRSQDGHGSREKSRHGRNSAKYTDNVTPQWDQDKDERREQRRQERSERFLAREERHHTNFIDREKLKFVRQHDGWLADVDADDELAPWHPGFHQKVVEYKTEIKTETVYVPIYIEVPSPPPPPIIKIVKVYIERPAPKPVPPQVTFPTTDVPYVPRPWPEKPAATIDPGRPKFGGCSSPTPTTVRCEVTAPIGIGPISLEPGMGIQHDLKTGEWTVIVKGKACAIGDLLCWDDASTEFPLELRPGGMNGNEDEEQRKKEWEEKERQRADELNRQLDETGSRPKDLCEIPGNEAFCNPN